MIWLTVALLALAVFAVTVFVFRLDRKLWTSFAAALAFGLAGYAWQASPDLPSAPKAPQESRQQSDLDIVAQRREFIADRERSQANLLYTADGMARMGQYSDAAEFLNGITRQNPNDFEAWLALGNTLVEHADGALTAPALYAYRQAATLAPEHPGPGYFLGVALIRQGRYMEARGIWAGALANAPEDAAGRAGLEERLLLLDEMLGLASGAQESQGPSAAAPTAAVSPETSE